MLISNEHLSVGLVGELLAILEALGIFDFLKVQKLDILLAELTLV